MAEIFFRLLTCMKKELPDTLQLMELLDDNEEMQAFVGGVSAAAAMLLCGCFSALLLMLCC